jgi:hypothetical protein
MRQAAMLGATLVGPNLMLDSTSVGLFLNLPSFCARSSLENLRALDTLFIGVDWPTWTTQRATQPSSDMVVVRKVRDAPPGKAGLVYDKHGEDATYLDVRERLFDRNADLERALLMFNAFSGNDQKSIHVCGKGLDRRFVVAPSGSGKSYIVKTDASYVDADELVRWPKKFQWWLDPAEQVRMDGIVRKTISDWLNGPRDGKTIFYADDLGLKADAYVKLPAAVHRRRLSMRAKETGQPGIADWPRIVEGRRRLGEPQFVRFSDALARPDVLALWSNESGYGYVTFATYMAQKWMQAGLSGASSSSAAPALSGHYGLDLGGPRTSGLIVYTSVDVRLPTVYASQSVYVKPFTGAIRSLLGHGPESMARLRVTAAMYTKALPEGTEPTPDGLSLSIPGVGDVKPSGHTANLVMQSGVAPIDVARYWAVVANQDAGRTRREVAMAKHSGDIVEVGGFSTAPFHTWWEYYTAIVAAPNIALYFGFPVPKLGFRASRDYLLQSGRKDEVKVRYAKALPDW